MRHIHVHCTCKESQWVMQSLWYMYCGSFFAGDSFDLLSLCCHHLPRYNSHSSLHRLYVGMHILTHHPSCPLFHLSVLYRRRLHWSTDVVSHLHCIGVGWWRPFQLAEVRSWLPSKAYLVPTWTSLWLLLSSPLKMVPAERIMRDNVFPWGDVALQSFYKGLKVLNELTRTPVVTLSALRKFSPSQIGLNIYK